MKPFAHANALSVREAVEVLDGDCRPLAGGTDLLGLMKEGLVSPQRLVNLKTIEILQGVSLHYDGWHIGAVTTLAQVAAARLIVERPELAVLVQAIVASASPQLRHMATLGGNLLQQPRCWYYRNPLVPCWRKGGQACYAFRGENAYHVILGGGPCYAAHPSDPAVALLALDAQLALRGKDGTRRMPLGEFYQSPSREKRGDNILALDELISGVVIPVPPAMARGCYVKIARRPAWDFGLASAAVQLVLDGDLVQRARIALGGVATIPWRATQAEEALTGQRLTDETIDSAAQAAIAGSRPLAQNAYKVNLLQGVVRQALNTLRNQ